MIKVITGKLDNLEYDARALIGAFYPGEEIEYDSDFDKQSRGERLPDGDGKAPESRDTSEENIIILEKIIDAKLPKNEQRKQLYRFLAQRTGKQLPWGALTGVRPTKLAMNAIRSGMTEADTAKMMQAEYLVSEEKAKLAAEIAEREITILKKGRGLNLYIGIAFCPTTCLYCSFTSFSTEKWGRLVDDYLEALFKEIDWAAKRFAGEPVRTVYIGGGTPTSLDAAQLRRLLQKIRDSFDLSDLQEYTVEAGRPDSIDREKLETLKNYGVSRISINPQTMNDKTLRLIGRNHSAAEVREKYVLARKLGFENINMDIILGLPGETAKDVEETVRQIKELEPDSLTVHALAIKRASRLKMESEGVPMAKSLPGTAQKMMEAASAGAAQMGLLPYYMYRQKNMAGNLENVGYAKEGKEGLYNVIIIEETDSIVALGAGTVTKRVFENGEIKRCDCVKNIEEYISRIDEMIDRKEKLFQ